MDKILKQSGYTLITTMLIMIMLFVIGMAGAMLVYYGNLTSSAMTNYQKAYYNADYGLQQVAYNAMNGLCNCQNNGCGIQRNLSTGGSVTVVTQADTNNMTCFIESTGVGQTGGQVAKAIALYTGISNWGAFGALSGSLGLSGSASINGCDYIDQCQATGLLQGSSLQVSSNLNLYTCQNNPNPNNPKGVVGNPATKSTNATDIAQLITQFNSFSLLQSYIQNQVCSYFGASINQDGSCGTPTSNNQCYCPSDATASAGSITCGSTILSNTCQYYYIGGTLNVDSTSFANNQIVYANGVSISGNTLNIQGGLIDSYGSNGLSIATHGNSQIGSSSSPTTLIAQTASIDMHGTSSINGLLLFNSLSNANIGNANINGALYANTAQNVSGVNASINFNYAILQQITNAFPNLFIPINCYSQIPQEMFNAVSLY